MKEKLLNSIEGVIRYLSRVFTIIYLRIGIIYLMVLAMMNLGIDVFLGTMIMFLIFFFRRARWR
jgi:hypothetical protein